MMSPKATSAFLSLAGLSLGGCHATSTPEAETPQPLPNTNEAAVTAPDDTFISLRGTIVDARDDSFSLDYGTGTILVEMDDFRFDPDGRPLLENDQVIVYGYVDDDFYESRSIEASSVYVKNLGTQFYANGVDEEDFPVVSVQEYSPRIEMTGEVRQIDGREFQLDTAAGIISVDTQPMYYNPLDDEGFQKLQAGDRVRVSGRLDHELFDGLTLDAEYIVSLAESDAS